MRLILSEWFFFGKMWKNMEKWPFFRAAMAGLGKYRTGGYGRIGVYRVNLIYHKRDLFFAVLEHWCTVRLVEWAISTLYPMLYLNNSRSNIIGYLVTIV